jgi:hypothetical protein
MTDKFNPEDKSPSKLTKKMSKEEWEMRKPLPPEILISALQEPVHKDIGCSKFVKASKSPIKPSRVELE